MHPSLSRSTWRSLDCRSQWWRKCTPPQPAKHADLVTKVGISQIPVDSFIETSGGGTMVSQASNRYDLSPAPQRSPNEVYQTPRFRSPDPDRNCHDRLALSRRLRQDNAHRTGVSHLQDLSLSPP